MAFSICVYHEHKFECHQFPKHVNALLSPYDSDFVVPDDVKETKAATL